MGGPGRRRNTKGPALNADPASQARLLDLQALDSSLDRLDHRRRTLPELATIDELTSRLREVSDALVTAETLESDLARDQRKAEGDVDQVRQRSDRDQQRLDAGQVSSPRELENLQSEIGSLCTAPVRSRGRRARDHGAPRNGAGRSMSSLVSERDKLTGELASVTSRRDELFGEIDAEIAASRAARAAVAPDVGAELLALYEKIRASSDGVGAAALHRARCEGCHLTVNPAELGQTARRAA